MSSSDAFEHETSSHEMELNQGTKRAGDSLFMNEDDAMSDPGSHGSKRLRTEHADEDTHDANTGGLMRDRADEDFLAALKIDDDGFVLPYRPSECEGPPPLAIYHPSFNKAEKTVSEICTEFMAEVEARREEGYECTEIDNICANKLKGYLNLQHRYHSVEPIACLGSAGIGKSSFTGCVLGHRGVAPESDGTKRGTNVVHEYSSAVSDQTALFQVGAIYYRRAQIEALTTKHCHNIFTFLNQASETDEEELDDLQRKYETGIEFFQTLLCDQSGFESTEDIQEYFDTNKDSEEEDVVKQLTDCIEEFKETRDINYGVEYHTAENSGELSDIFRLVSKPPKTAPGWSQKPHPWPIISKVQVHQDTDILNAGVVLADCPGITDSNQAVVDATTNYLRHAGTILIFASIKRVKDDPSLDANLRKCIQLGKSRNTKLIVTMIDIKQRIKPEERGDLLPEDEATLDEAEKRVARLRSEYKTLKQAKANATGDQYKELDKAYEAMPKKIALAEAHIDQVTIEIRNKEVAADLRGKFRKLDRNKNAPDLPVYFVSSTQYQKHLAGYDATQPPCLDIEGTGIPSVKYMLWEIPARGKINTLHRISRNHLPRIFNGILGVLTKSPLARKEEVEKLIVKILDRRHLLLKDLVEELSGLFDRRITATIAANKEKWEEKASKLIAGWEKYRAVTFLAFCRRSGHWRPKKDEEFISWNEKIQNIFVDRLAGAFNALDDDIIAVRTNSVTNLDDLLSRLERELEDCEDFQGNSEAKPFFEMIRRIKDDMVGATKKLFEDFTNGVDVIRHATLLDGNASYVASAMQKTYEVAQIVVINPQPTVPNSRAKVYKKSGAHLNRVDTLRQKLLGQEDKKSVFASVSEAAKKDFQLHIKAWERHCETKLEEGCHEIHTDFGMRFEVPDVKPEENPEAVYTMKMAAKKALDRIEGELKDHVDAFEAYEKSGGALK